MSDEFGLKIDLLRLARRVAPDEQTEATEAEAARWLAENNFRREGDHWVADAHDIGMLEKDEVLSVWPADEPGSATDDEAGRVDPSWPKPQPYVLTAERRAMFRSMPDYDQCVIPEFLCGTPASVKSKWRRVALKLYGKAHYTFMSDYKFVHVDDAPGKLITWRKRGLAPSEHNVVLYPILPELSELIFDKETYRHGTYIVQRQLWLEGLDHFWFALCFFAESSRWPIVMDRSYDADIKEIRKLALSKILRWWPHFCVRGDRFANGDGTPRPWPQSGGRVCGLMRDSVDYPQLRSLDCEAAGQFFRDAIATG